METLEAARADLEASLVAKGVELTQALTTSQSMQERCEAQIEVLVNDVAKLEGDKTELESQVRSLMCR